MSDDQDRREEDREIAVTMVRIENELGRVPKRYRAAADRAVRATMELMGRERLEHVMAATQRALGELLAREAAAEIRRKRSMS